MFSKIQTKKIKKAMAWWIIASFLIFNVASIAVPTAALAASKSNGSKSSSSSSKSSSSKSNSSSSSSKSSPSLSKKGVSQNSSVGSGKSYNGRATGGTPLKVATTTSTSSKKPYNTAQTNSGNNSQKTTNKQIKSAYSGIKMGNNVVREKPISVAGYYAGKIVGGDLGKVTSQVLEQAQRTKDAYAAWSKNQSITYTSRVGKTAQFLKDTYVDMKAINVSALNRNTVSFGSNIKNTWIAGRGATTLGSKFTGLGSKISAIAKVGGPVLGAVGGAITFVDGVKQISKGQKVSGWLDVVGGIAATGAAVAMVAFPPAAAVLGGVALAASGTAAVVRNWKTIKSGVKTFIADPKGTTKKIVQGAVNGIKNNFGTIATAAGAVILAKYGKNLGKAVGKGIDTVVNAAKKIGPAVVTGAKAVVNVAKKVGSAVATGAKAVSTVAKKVSSAVAAGAKTVSNTAKKVAATTSKAVSAVASTAKKAVSSVAKGIKKLFSW